MSTVLINESTLTSIGGAIRAKTGGSALLDPANMATEIGTIPTYSAADNGKVVEDGQLINQTNLTTENISKNKTYEWTTTNNKKVTANVAVPTDAIQYIGRANSGDDMATKNKVSFLIDGAQWVNGNEICLLLTSADMSSIKIKAPVWDMNTSMGGAGGTHGNQGGWFTNLFNNGSVREGVVITIRCAADGSFYANNLTDWVAVTMCGSAFSMQYFLTADPNTVKFYVDNSTRNTIEFTTNGLKINGVNLNAASYHSKYMNGGWTESTVSGGSINEYANYFVSMDYIYFGVATASTANTGLCINKVLFG